MLKLCPSESQLSANQQQVDLISVFKNKRIHLVVKMKQIAVIFCKKFDKTGRGICENAKRDFRSF